MERFPYLPLDGAGLTPLSPTPNVPRTCLPRESTAVPFDPDHWEPLSLSPPYCRVCFRIPETWQPGLDSAEEGEQCWGCLYP